MMDFRTFLAFEPAGALICKPVKKSLLSYEVLNIVTARLTFGFSEYCLRIAKRNNILNFLTCFTSVKFQPHSFVSEPRLRMDPYVSRTDWWNKLVTDNVHSIPVCFKRL